MPFEKRLAWLNKSNIPRLTEIDGAIRLYERALTAQAICNSVIGPNAGNNPQILLPVLQALCDEVRLGKPLPIKGEE